MHFFRYDDLSEVRAGDVIEPDDAENTHIFRILRMRPGEHAGLLDGHGMRAETEIMAHEQLKIITTEQVPEPSRKIHLYFAPPRKQKLDQLLKQAAELGVWHLAPMLCDWSVAEPHEKSVAGRWQTLLFEACKQSTNPYLPTVAAPVPFKEALKTAPETCSLLVTGSPRESGLPDLSGQKDIAFFVGPEGGFSPAELKQLEEAGAKPLRIGQWILRVETAVTAGLSVLQTL